MPNHKNMERTDKIDKLLRQNPRGISASEIAEKIDVDRSTVYDPLNSLKLRGKAFNREGLWFPSEPKEVPGKSGFWDFLNRRAERKKQEAEETYCNAIAPAMVIFRRRAAEGSEHYKNVVEQEERLHPRLRIDKQESTDNT